MRETKKDNCDWNINSKLDEQRMMTLILLDNAVDIIPFESLGIHLKTIIWLDQGGLIKLDHDYPSKWMPTKLGKKFCNKLYETDFSGIKFCEKCGQVLPVE